MNNTSSRKSASSYSAPSVAPVSYSAPSYSASAHTAAPPVVVNSNDAAISALLNANQLLSNRLASLEQVNVKQNLDKEDLKLQVATLASKPDNTPNILSQVSKMIQDHADLVKSQISAVDKPDNTPAILSHVNRMFQDHSNLVRSLIAAMDKPDNTSNILSQVDNKVSQVHRTIADSVSQLQLAQNSASQTNSLLVSRLDKLEGSLSTVAANKSSAADSQLAAANKKIDQQNSVITQLSSLVKQQNDTLNLLSSQLAQIKADLAMSQSNLQAQQLKANSGIVETLTVGSPANLPELPEPVMEAGVWKDAPLALTVSGGLALHNIGYTTKKGKPLTYDPETDRLYVYNGK